MIMKIHSKHRVTANRIPKVKSGLVRRLIQASDDKAKQRIRRLLVDIDDQRLLALDFTPDDIASCA